MYSPNSPIPIWITVSGSDNQANALISTPKSLAVRLRRSLAIGVDADDDKREERTDTTFLEVTARGVIWPPDDNPGESNSDKRVLEGELFVPIKTKPSFIFPNVSLRVSHPL